MRLGRSLLLALLAAGLCAAAPVPADAERAPGSATGVRGVAGTADARSVIDFGELARAERGQRPERVRVLAPRPGRRPEFAADPEAAAAAQEPIPGATSAAASPVASPSFKALGDNGTTIPPDTDGAVGPNHVMTALNSQVRIQDRTGGVISAVSLATFWSSVNPIDRRGPDTFDPKLVFDPYGTGSGDGRFVFVTLSDAESASSSILIGVSQTSDPTGQWNLYRVDADASNQNWADFPSVGFNKNWIVVQVNIFRSGVDSFERGDVYAFDKLNLYAGGSASGRFTRFPDAEAFSDAPTVTYDPAQETEFLVEDLDGNSQGRGVLRMSSITGSVSAPVFTPQLALPSATAPWADIPNDLGSDFAPQKGTAKKIQVNDANVLGCVYRNGSIWCAHTIFLPANSPTHSAIQWWQLAPDGSIQQRVRIDDPNALQFYAFPSIAVNSQSDVLVGFSSFAETQFASAAYAFQAGTDPRGTMREVTILKAGEAPYFKTFGGDFNRWGDYSSTAVDPVNDLDMWTLQEFADSPSTGCSGDCWATWWGRIAPPPSQPAPGSLQLSAASYSANEDAGTATITVTRTGGSQGQVSVSYATSPGTATPGSDYQDASETLTFVDGVVTQTFAVPIVNDTAREPDETVQLALSNPQGGATLGSPSSGTLTIVDDDAATFRPDVLIKGPSGPYVGDDVYNRTGARQTRATKAPPGTKRTFLFYVENDGSFADTIRITGPGDSGDFRVRYSEGGSNLSKPDGGLNAAVRGLPPGKHIFPVKIVITVLGGAPRGRTKTVTITAASIHGPADVAKARVTAL